jgi:hypothetical protein
MQVNSQLHSQVHLAVGKESLVHIQTPELVFMFLRGEKSVASGGIWTPDHRACTPVTTLTTLSRLQSNITKHCMVWSNITKHSTWSMSVGRDSYLLFYILHHVLLHSQWNSCTEKTNKWFHILYCQCSSLCDLQIITSNHQLSPTMPLQYLLWERVIMIHTVTMQQAVHLRNVQTVQTSCGAHHTPCSKDSEGTFPGVQKLGSEPDHSSSSSAGVNRFQDGCHTHTFRCTRC